MPTIKMLSRLFQAIGGEDWARAEALASEICKSEDRNGHHSAARLLRGALHSSGPLNGNRMNGAPPTTNGWSAHPAISRLDQTVKLSDVILPPAIRRELQDVIREWHQRERLREHGLRHRGKLLFHGPPGCGKSFTALALGHETGLAVYVVRFNAVIGAYLGQTAINLRHLFHFAETTPCVLLLDELDALGKQRGSAHDVGELDRIVISLMQELEHSAPKGLVVAATNLPGQLDRALWRRFDLALHLPAPRRATLLEYAAKSARARRTKLSPQTLQLLRAARSFADVVRVVEDEARRQVLKGARP